MKITMNRISSIQITLVSILYYFSFLHLHCSANTSKNMYFIKCGSNTSVVLSDGRVFEGDFNSSAVTLTSNGTIIDTNPSASNGALLLYQTARIFMQKSSYNFNIMSKGIYILRIHFFAFSSTFRDLVAATFSVAASSSIPSSAFSLLRNFSVKNTNSGPLIKEFLLNIEIGEFSIYFVPEASSFAFVSAIELLLPGENVFPDDDQGVLLITPQGIADYLNNTIITNVLQTVYRINAGGPEIKPDADALWRRWIPDDYYLVDPKTAETKTGKVQGNDANFAPDAVFQDARVMKPNFSIVSWSFGVRKHARHFVRAHFYDVVGSSMGQVNFNFSIYKNFSEPVNGTLAWSAPIYNDYIVDSDDNGFLNVSLVPDDLSLLKSAYLNGLEIMEMTDILQPKILMD